MEVKLMFSELPAVIAGGYLHYARTARGPDPYAHRLGDRLGSQAVDHDLQNRPHPLRQFALRLPPQGGAKSGVRRGVEEFIARTNLAPASDYAARKRHDHALDLPHRLDRALRRFQRARQLLS